MQEEKNLIVVFDICGVMTKGRFSQAFAERVEKMTGIDNRRIVKIYRENENLYLKGQESQEDFFRRIAEELGIGDDIDMPKLFLDCVSIDEEVIKIADELKEKGYKLYIASDNYHELAKHLLETHKIGTNFDRIYLSNYLGVIKKEEEFFRRVISHHDPKRFILIDDKEVNINAAKNLGMRGILFKDAEDLKIRLKEEIGHFEKE